MGTLIRGDHSPGEPPPPPSGDKACQCPKRGSLKRTRLCKSFASFPVVSHKWKHSQRDYHIISVVWSNTVPFWRKNRDVCQSFRSSGTHLDPPTALQSLVTRCNIQDAFVVHFCSFSRLSWSFFSCSGLPESQPFPCAGRSSLHTPIKLRLSHNNVR